MCTSASHCRFGRFTRHAIPSLDILIRLWLNAATGPFHIDIYYVVPIICLFVGHLLIERQYLDRTDMATYPVDRSITNFTLVENTDSPIVPHGKHGDTDGNDTSYLYLISIVLGLILQCNLV